MIYVIDALEAGINVSVETIKNQKVEVYTDSAVSLDVDGVDQLIAALKRARNTINNEQGEL